MRCDAVVRHDFDKDAACTLDVKLNVRNCLTTSAAVTVQVEGREKPESHVRQHVQQLSEDGGGGGSQVG